jgi:NAD(P)-dependent dehydrogenase (short-subunit alcohol dehydrogenase family)
MEFTNKTVVISGGASGIGLLCGENFAREGANIVLADINPDSLDAAVEKVKAISEKVIGCVTDVTKYEQVELCINKAKETFGSVDIVIPCAGGAETRILGDHRNFYDQPISVFDFGVDLNLKGAVYFAHASLRAMKEQRTGGVITLLGSITGEESDKGTVAYATSKSALMNGTLKGLALCGAEIGVRVNTVAPGPVLTREAMANMKTLMGRAAETQEIVDLIMYLCSDKASFITGESILIDGGRHLMMDKKQPRWRHEYEK